MKGFQGLCLMLGAVMAMCGCHPVAAAAEAVGAIEGRVIEEGTGKGIEGVQIRAKGPEGTYKAVSDAGGNYAIRELPEGIYGLSVDSEYAGRMKEQCRQESVDAGRVVKNATITLAARHEYAIEVSVKDAKGNPVEDAELKIGRYISPVNICLFKQLPGAATDSTGRSSLKFREQAGKYVLLALKKRVGEGRSEPFVLGDKNGTRAIEVIFYKGISIKGRVSDAKGTPLAGARVSIGDTGEFLGSSDTATTDKDGTYEIVGLGTGDKNVTARREGYAKAKKKITLSASGSPQEVNFTLPQGLSICGTVSDNKGNPVHNARVSAWSSGASSSAKTDQDGEYCLEDIRAGKFKVRVSKEGYDKVERENVKAGSNNVDFTLAAGGA